MSFIRHLLTPATLAVGAETLSHNLGGAAGYEFTRVLDRKPTSLGRVTFLQSVKSV